MVSRIVLAAASWGQLRAARLGNVGVIEPVEARDRGADRVRGASPFRAACLSLADFCTGFRPLYRWVSCPDSENGHGFYDRQNTQVAPRNHAWRFSDETDRRSPNGCTYRRCAGRR